MLQPWGKRLLGTTLRYPYEVRGEEAYFDDIPDVKIPKDMLQLAEHILETKKADFDATKFHDRYEQAMIEMIDVKKAGMPPAVQKRLVPRIVGGTDLMAALRQSIADSEREDKAAKKPAAIAAAAKSKKGAKINAGQREMLLPITGGGKAAAATAKEADKAPIASKPAARKKAG
jgi:DNA end-binding protein Ku